MRDSAYNALSSLMDDGMKKSVFFTSAYPSSHFTLLLVITPHFSSKIIKSEKDSSMTKGKKKAVYFIFVPEFWPCVDFGGQGTLPLHL